MAEAVAIIGLVGSIASLVDICSKLLSRLHQFNSATSDIPETFRSLHSQLPLLTKTLERFQPQSQKILSDDVANALIAIIDETSIQVTLVQNRLSDVLLQDSDRTRDKLMKALKSLAKEDKIAQAVDKIHKSIDILTLYQTTENAAANDRILQEIAALRLASSPNNAPQTKVSIAQPPNKYAYGVCLGQAPQIDVDAFVGRSSELAQLQEWLPPGRHSRRQSIVTIVGMGGMGKTQLSLAHVNACADDYSSVFWVNADTEDSVQQGLVDIDSVIYSENPASQTGQDNDQFRINRVRRWLSESENDKWLLIFDNYDDPQLPGLRSSTGYDIRSFFPLRAQGSVLITSRIPKLTFGKQLKIREITDLDTSLAILSSRSQLDISNDSGAEALAKRLHGLPLALATAGAYIGRAMITCDDYLNLYESAWSDLVGSEDEVLLEYETRTMASTWNISLDKVKRQDKDAASIFLFFAYLGNSDIDYELIKAGTNDQESWVGLVTETRIRFQRTIAKLQDYSLVEATQEGYRIHPCLYDWLVASMESPPKLSLFATALIAVSNRAKECRAAEDNLAPRKLVHHVQRLMCSQLSPLWQQLHDSVIDIELTLDEIGHFVLSRGPRRVAKGIYEQMLATYDKQFGRYHQIPRVIALYLARMYADLCEYDKAEPMFRRLLDSGNNNLKKASLSNITEDLGRLYYNQGNLQAARETYTQAHKWYSEALGPNDDATLRTLVELHTLNLRLGKMTAAETETAITEIQNHCLQSRRSDHHLILHNLICLADVYISQNKLDQAEAVYSRVLADRAATWGVGNASEFQTLQRLGDLYQRRGNWIEAAKLLVRALGVAETTLGYTHNWTLRIVEQLGDVNFRLDKPEVVSSMYSRAIASYSSTLEDQGTLWRADVRHFGAVLAKSIITNDRKLHDPHARIHRLVHLTKDYFKDENILLDLLARTLASVGADEDAHAGYEIYATTIDLGAWAGAPQLCCDGCSKPCDLNKGLHVCRLCPDVDVCAQCMSEGSVPDQAVSTCLQHSFFHFQRSRRPDVLPTLADFEDSCRAWLQKLDTDYRVSYKLAGSTLS